MFLARKKAFGERKAFLNAMRLLSDDFFFEKLIFKKMGFLLFPVGEKVVFESYAYLLGYFPALNLKSIF